MKTCSKCCIEKPLSDFGINKKGKDGRASICKTCKREWRKSYFLTEKYRAYLSKNRQKIRDSHWRFRHSAKGKQYLRRRNEARLSKYPEKIKANKALNQKIRSGIIKRQPCSKCGDPVAQGHHPDYSKPLEVIWLCRKHHLDHHSK